VELRNALFHFDTAWTVFEHRYIIELIEIEAEARGLVMKAVEEEKQLALLEKRKGGAKALTPVGVEEPPPTEEEFRAQRRKLLEAVARLNSAANLRWKGREDRGVELLECSLVALKQCFEAKLSGPIAERGEKGVIQVLASGVAEAFDQVRRYLREVPKWIDSVHPHLCNNAGLVACMTTWTESWELGARYMEPEPLRRAICQLVRGIHNVRALAPALGTMCDECDAELFLVLPRIVWMRYLTEPPVHLELVRRLVPHHFDGEAPPRPTAELEGFQQKFQHVSSLLAGQEEDRAGGSSREQRAWEALVTRVVAGPSGTKGDGPSSPEAAAESGGAEAVTEAFVHELERWSMELQRHHPEDWCQCSLVLVRCLAGELPPAPVVGAAGEASKVPFCV